MRVGQNPAKLGVPAYKPHRLGIATIVYIPSQEGYFAHSLEVFRYHLASVHQYTSEPFNYLVFDNGSCVEVKRELESLHEAGWIDWLILSEHNLGKTGALNIILGGMPNEWICYADSDMLFRAGWLEASWKIVESFPNIGMVGAQVVFPDWEEDKGNTAFRQTKDPRFRFDQVKAESWILDEYCRGRGIQGEREQFYRNMPLDRVTNVETGVQAFLGGNSHQQFLAPRKVLQEILPLPATLQLSRHEDTYQDVELDRRGYLHLTTTRPYLYHMGNTVDEILRPELDRLQLPGKHTPPKSLSEDVDIPRKLHWRWLKRLAQSPRTRPWLIRAYRALYRVLY
ncbi:glycosyltransferase family 2 protein [uncultured Thermanaerothrix sp.]|uniref:glycosyltransferase family A protein n=1 Tax=uncultured Thermanaerothrix sp. TaxID=1195149 RepID=UPI00261C7BFB|nr:glycosyltransferase family 2 protein [uncultured Thermanaerothrix sp.]